MNKIGITRALNKFREFSRDRERASMADLEAVLADVSYLMAMEKSKGAPAARLVLYCITFFLFTSVFVSYLPINVDICLSRNQVKFFFIKIASFSS